MNTPIDLVRRQFFTSSASGLGMLALASLLRGDGLLADDAERQANSANPLAPKAPPFAPKAKNCIFFLPEGAPSHIDLFDPKPKLKELHEQKLPDEMTKNVRFAFIKKETAVLWGSNAKFTKHGQCGMELSHWLPHLGKQADDICLIRSMHTDAFNHHPAQLMMMSGVPRFGRPSMGSWLTYGLGSESENLPGYVVLTAGRGGSGGVSNWSSGFLPSTYQGVLFRGQGEPILNLASPPGVTPEMQKSGLDAIASLNRRHLEDLHDPEIASRIASYELAFRMQSAAPKLVDLSQESQKILDMYGVSRPEPKGKGGRGSGPDVYKRFATNCLLARRLVERGADSRPQATGAPRQHAPRICGRIRPHAAGREPERADVREGRPRPPSFRLQRLDGRRRHQARPDLRQDRRARLGAGGKSRPHQRLPRHHPAAIRL